MKYFIIGLVFTLTAIAEEIPKELRLNMQIAELELKLLQERYNNTMLTRQILETEFKTSQTKHSALQDQACRSVGGQGKDDCTFTAEAVEKKIPAKAVEVRK